MKEHFFPFSNLSISTPRIPPVPKAAIETTGRRRRLIDAIKSPWNVKLPFNKSRFIKGRRQDGIQEMKVDFGMLHNSNHI